MEQLPDELLVQIIHCLGGLDQPIFIKYRRYRGSQSRYRDFRALALVNRKFDKLTTKEFYGTPPYVCCNTRVEPAALPIFLSGLRESTIEYIQSIAFALPHATLIYPHSSAFQEGLDLLWHYCIPLMKVSISGLPELAHLDSLRDFDKIKRMEFDIETISCTGEQWCELEAILKDIQNVVYRHRRRTITEQNRLTMRQATKARAVEKASYWIVKKVRLPPRRHPRPLRRRLPNQTYWRQGGAGNSPYVRAIRTFVAVDPK